MHGIGRPTKVLTMPGHVSAFGRLVLSKREVPPNLQCALGKDLQECLLGRVHLFHKATSRVWGQWSVCLHLLSPVPSFLVTETLPCLHASVHVLHSAILLPLFIV